MTATQTQTTAREDRIMGGANLNKLILHGTADKVTKPAGSQLFFDTAGSKDKTLKLYEGHFHDLLNDLDKERVMSDIKQWINARVSAN